MYVNFYQLRGQPFGITPDPRFLFLSAAHREALAALVYGVSQRKGFISIIGEVGTGKTIVLRAFLEGIDSSQTTAVSLLNPLASFEQIIDEILPAEFEGTTSDRFRTLQEWLIEEYRQGRNVVVAIDEAQCMAPSTLEKLRLLSNLETSDHKLIQVVLAGQPELEDKLAQPNLRQLRERITVRAKIWPLNQANSIAYINYRLSKVLAPGTRPVFTDPALWYIARQARGNPRRLNILCDAALLTGFSYQKRPISVGIALESVTGADKPPNWKQARAIRLLTVFSMIVLTIGLAVYGSRWTMNDEVMSRSSMENPAIPHIGNPSKRQIQALSTSLASEPAVTVQSTDSQVMTIENDSPADKDQEIVSTDYERIDDTAKDLEAVNPQRTVESRTVIVKSGDGLWQLCRDVYGEADSAIVRRVAEANPHLRDPENLEVGTRIVFPYPIQWGDGDMPSVAAATLED